MPSNNEAGNQTYKQKTLEYKTNAERIARIYPNNKIVDKIVKFIYEKSNIIHNNQTEIYKNYVCAKNAALMLDETGNILQSILDYKKNVKNRTFQDRKNFFTKLSINPKNWKSIKSKYNQIEIAEGNALSQLNKTVDKYLNDELAYRDAKYVQKKFNVLFGARNKAIKVGDAVKQYNETVARYESFSNEINKYKIKADKIHTKISIYVEKAQFDQDTYVKSLIEYAGKYITSIKNINIDDLTESNINDRLKDAKNYVIGVTNRAKYIKNVIDILKYIRDTRKQMTNVTNTKLDNINSRLENLYTRLTRTRTTAFKNESKTEIHKVYDEFKELTDLKKEAKLILKQVKKILASPTEEIKRIQANTHYIIGSNQTTDKEKMRAAKRRNVADKMSAGAEGKNIRGLVNRGLLTVSAATTSIATKIVKSKEHAVKERAARQKLAAEDKAAKDNAARETADAKSKRAANYKAAKDRAETEKLNREHDKKIAKDAMRKVNNAYTYVENAVKRMKKNKPVYDEQMLERAETIRNEIGTIRANVKQELNKVETADSYAPTDWVYLKGKCDELVNEVKKIENTLNNAVKESASKSTEQKNMKGLFSRSSKTKPTTRPIQKSRNNQQQGKNVAAPPPSAKKNTKGFFGNLGDKLTEFTEKFPSLKKTGSPEIRASLQVDKPNDSTSKSENGTTALQPTNLTIWDKFTRQYRSRKETASSSDSVPLLRVNSAVTNKKSSENFTAALQNETDADSNAVNNMNIDMEKLLSFENEIVLTKNKVKQDPNYNPLPYTDNDEGETEWLDKARKVFS
jgi:hypothetical protein